MPAMSPAFDSRRQLLYRKTVAYFVNPIFASVKILDLSPHAGCRVVSGLYGCKNTRNSTMTVRIKIYSIVVRLTIVGNRWNVFRALRWNRKLAEFRGKWRENCKRAIDIVMNPTKLRSNTVAEQVLAEAFIRYESSKFFPWNVNKLNKSAKGFNVQSFLFL